MIDKSKFEAKFQAMKKMGRPEGGAGLRGGDSEEGVGVTAGMLLGGAIGIPAGALAGVVSMCLTGLALWVLFLALGFLLTLPILFYVIAALLGLFTLAGGVTAYYLSHVAIGISTAKLVSFYGAKQAGYNRNGAALLALIAGLLALPVMFLAIQAAGTVAPSALSFVRDMYGKGFVGLGDYDWNVYTWLNLAAAAGITSYAAVMKATDREIKGIG